MLEIDCQLERGYFHILCKVSWFVGLVAECLCWSQTRQDDSIARTVSDSNLDTWHQGRTDGL